MKRLFAAAALCLLAASAAAQYPAKPVRLIVPLAPGGASDTAARALGPVLAKSLGQPVVFDNRPGANGAIAAQAIVNAAPDGHTLLWGLGSFVGLPAMMKAAPYESLGELAPVSIVGRLTFAMFTHPGVPAKNLAEFIAHARVNPDKLAYASATASEHMAAAQLMKATGISMVRVPYKGGAQALPDLLAGRVQVYFTPISPGLPHVKEGKLRLIATLLPQRTPVAPDAPTIAEAGMAGVSVPTWQAIFAPPKTPREITDRLARDIAQAMKDPDLRAQFERLAILPEGSTPEVLAAAIRDEQKVWAQFVRDNGIVPE